MTYAPWPYPDQPETAAVDGKPRWACPHGICRCSKRREEEATFPYRLVLFDHGAERLPGARVRVFENGHLINDEPWAGDDASVSLQLLDETTSLLVEWAPWKLPQGPRYPYRRVVHVELGGGEQGARRRLDNIGFDLHADLPLDTQTFDEEYGLPHTEPTQDWRRILTRLVAFHDGGALPPLGTKTTLGGIVAEGGQVRMLDDPQGPPGGPATAPAVANPKPSTGAAAVVQAQAITVELAMCFSLFASDFDRTDGLLAAHGGTLPKSAEPLPPKDPSTTPTKNVFEYDVEAIVKRYLRGKAHRLFRYGQKSHGHRVEGARLSLTGPGVSVHAITEKRSTGKVNAVLRLPKNTPLPVQLRIEVEPPPGQFTPNGLPAGPLMSGPTTTASHLFRPFSIDLKLDATGDVDPSSVRVNLPHGKSPPYARDISVPAGVPANTLLIDWRPDWIKPAERLARIPRPSPNPFDSSLTPEEAAKLAKPPVWINHGPDDDVIGSVIGSLSSETRTKSNGNVVQNFTTIHYVIDLDGHVVKLIDESHRAGHAGESIWLNHISVNDFAVGVEIVHKDKDSSGKYRPVRYTNEQYRSLIRIIGDNHIPPRNIIGHAEVRVVKAAPGNVNGRLSEDRKFCPGEMMEWERLEVAGLALKLDMAALETAVAAATPQLIKFGFPHSAAERATIQHIKRQLFRLGYSVTTKLVANPTKLNDKYTPPLFHAVRAFQTRYFSGSRLWRFDATKPSGQQLVKRYGMFNGDPSKRPLPVGTLDTPTILAVDMIAAQI